jgi:hypothetical protein
MMPTSRYDDSLDDRSRGGPVGRGNRDLVATLFFADQDRMAASFQPSQGEDTVGSRAPYPRTRRSLYRVWAVG